LKGPKIDLRKSLGLLSVVILFLGLCGLTYFQTNPDPLPVNIRSDCTVDWTERRAPIDGEVVWNPPGDGHVYSVDFNNKGRSPFPVNPIPAGTPEPVQGTTFCSRTSVYVNWPTDFCKFPYSVFKDGKFCKDPGVRVIPPNSITFVPLLLAVGLLGIASYFAFRIFVRNRTSPRNASKSGVA